MYRDSLEIYDELKAAGATEQAARVQAKQLGSMGNIMEAIQLELKWIMRIGGFIAVTLITIGVQIYLK